ncbi:MULTISPECIES: hypothetical protein [Ferrimonas]|uniref:hypothetical protein n=1 Tax=Ferrimonas TaxID=44011 RepID=UPI0003FE99F0|nr:MULTISPECIES: hypothetical protein [Ferrimonas]USD35891.1 hypothetical protein J8Z22_12635 [Ferrimonas sp. SCSIO 43195]
MRRLLVFLLIGILSGCTSNRQIDASGHDFSAIIENVKVGDEISITTLDGNEFKWVVDNIDDHSVAAGDEVIQFDEIKEIKKRETSVFKTTALVAGTTFAAIITYSAIAMLAMLGAF